MIKLLMTKWNRVIERWQSGGVFMRHTQSSPSKQPTHWSRMNQQNWLLEHSGFGMKAVLKLEM